MRPLYWERGFAVDMQRVATRSLEQLQRQCAHEYDEQSMRDKEEHPDARIAAIHDDIPAVRARVAAMHDDLQTVRGTMHSCEAIALRCSAIEEKIDDLHFG